MRKLWSIRSAVIKAVIILLLLALPQTLCAYVVDESLPIGQHWVKLGGLNVVGAPMSDINETPPGRSGKYFYQKFQNGVIVYAGYMGAFLLTEEIFNKWLSLDNEFAYVTGENMLEVLFNYVGCPIRDYEIDGDYKIGVFERGQIFQCTTCPGNPTYLVYGQIYWTYDLKSLDIGKPMNDVIQGDPNIWHQEFQDGVIFWRKIPPNPPKITPQQSAQAVKGNILSLYLAYGGPSGRLGVPISEEKDFYINNKTIRAQQFEHGVLYSDPGLGTMAVVGPIYDLYKQKGGPSGELGMPTATEWSTGSNWGQIYFNDFEKGVIIYLPYGEQTYAFTKLKLHFDKLEAGGSDCWEGICGDQELYVMGNIFTWDDSGTILDSIQYRFPAAGWYIQFGNVDTSYNVTPGSVVLKSNITVSVSMVAFDYDDTSNIDHLGTIQQTYDIHNLWGLFGDGPNGETSHYASTGDGSITAWFKGNPVIAYDANIDEFRRNQFWPFSNFSTPALSYAQYDQTFTDVDTSDSTLLNHFNKAYYELAYKGMAENGNCFGISLEAISAKYGNSVYEEPIHIYFPDTQNGEKLCSPYSPPTCSGPRNYLHQGLIDLINIKQGYQLGAKSIDWALLQFSSGNTHNPIQVYKDSKAAYERGDDPIISLSPDYFHKRGHAVFPYKFDDTNPSDWVMYVADSNWPSALLTDNKSVIHVYPGSNRWEFVFNWASGNPQEVWSGDDLSGGRLHYIPYSILNEEPRTPYAEIMMLLGQSGRAMLALAGDNCQTEQITDDQGRTFYEPNLIGPPTKWDQIRQDDNTRIPYFARIPLADANPVELYYGRADSATYRFEIVPKPNVPQGTPYNWHIHSAYHSSLLSIPSTPGIADIITAHGIGTTADAITVTIPPNSMNKEISWTITGPKKHRWIELTNLAMVPDQSITVHLANGGYKATFENDGPAATANLRVKANEKALPVDIGTFIIEAGQTTTLEFGAPHTTLDYTGGTVGKNGWLLSPVVVTLTATDYSSTGIDYIEYSKDGMNWIRYAGPFYYSDEGITKLYYRAKDKDGNQEALQSQEFKIDTKPPVVNVSTNLATYTRLDPIIVHYNAYDPIPGSGLESLRGTLNSEPVSDGQILDFFWSNLGTYAIIVVAGDIAGWKTTRSANFEIIATLQSLRSTIERLKQLGEINNEGIFKSFLSKVAAAIRAQERSQRKVVLNELDALLNDVKAQEEKHIISKQAASLLINDILYVESHLP